MAQRKQHADISSCRTSFQHSNGFMSLPFNVVSRIPDEKWFTNNWSLKGTTMDHHGLSNPWPLFQLYGNCKSEDTRNCRCQNGEQNTFCTPKRFWSNSSGLGSIYGASLSFSKKDRWRFSSIGKSLSINLLLLHSHTPKLAKYIDGLQNLQKDSKSFSKVVAQKLIVLEEIGNSLQVNVPQNVPTVTQKAHRDTASVHFPLLVQPDPLEFLQHFIYLKENIIQCKNHKLLHRGQ